MKFMKKTLLTALLLLAGLQLEAANEKETVEQVTATVTLTTDVDYIVTSDTPFGDEGIVDIKNTDHAVLILQGVKPSKAKRLLASHVQIEGEKAVDGTNCQLKLYNRGSIIMPYAKDIRPLTVYSEQNFGGEACNDFGLENTGGFMNTLSDEKLNNRIRSFKLKRGYMVTFSLRAEGRGYSRCFIAADQDLEMATLPGILDRSISSYRVFKWYDAGKPQLAAASGDNGACSALNVTSTYTWGTGQNMSPDVESVCHQIYTGYPSLSACGSVTWTPHLKTSNEPRNNSDDHPEDLNSILNNWEGLMRTGMRLCTPSSWDGSDYWNGTGFLKTFLDSIDARGWRCDILDMHCYWPENNFGNLKNWVNAVHRPIWISEWCWGASWNRDGAFANGVTENQVKNALQRICNNLNGMDYVERYFYWNGERDPSKLYKSGKLTPAGEMYAQLDGGLAYNGKYDYVPKAPKQQDPKDLQVYYDPESGKADLIWYEYNHEMNEYIHVECRQGNGQQWEVVRDVTGLEYEGQHTLSGFDARQGWEFRISEKDANGKLRQTKAVMAASSNVQAGDPVDLDGETWYLGGNMLVNGNFDMGLDSWLNGQQDAFTTGGQPWFQVVPTGGSSNGTYLQCYGSGSLKTVEALRSQVLEMAPETPYYFTADVANNPNITSRLALTVDGESVDSTVARLTASGNYWQTIFTTFHPGRFEKAFLTLSSLANKAQFDNIQLCRLFRTQDEAYADGAALLRRQVQAFMDYAPLFAYSLNTQLATVYDDKRQDYAYLRQVLADAIEAGKIAGRLESLYPRALRALTYQFPGYERLEDICNRLESTLTVLPGSSNHSGWKSSQWVIASYNELREAMEEYMPMDVLSDKVQNPTFASVNGWTTKAGTYKGGEQGISGQASYQALWKIPAEGNENETMAVLQELTGLTHGLYAVECDAATWHHCLSDQHAYITTDGKESAVSPSLTANYWDLPTVSASDRWQTLTSLPVYVAEGGSVTIGFQGSKQGAEDLAWREVGNSGSKGDHREGSWMATNFRLRFHPLYKPESIEEWGVACLPYAVAPHDKLVYLKIAAITSDYKTLCLEPITETEPGVPFIYRSLGGEILLPEYGEAVDKAADGPGNLRGFFRSAARVPVGYYYLDKGRWVKLADSDNRPRIGNFTAIMRPLNDKQSQPIPVVESWDGMTMPIEGITDEEIADGINDAVSLNNNKRTDYDKGFFDLQGRRLEGKPTQNGIYIRQGRKVIQ